MKTIDILANWIKLNKEFIAKLKQSKEINNYRNTSISEIYETVHSEARPCFVLSTGRCGTLLLTKIIETSPLTIVAHSPSPEPSWHSNWAFHNQSKNPLIVESVIDALRYEKIRNAYLQNNCYIETNNRITFFAHALSKLYPNSIFIHLYRSPIHFVLSGINRNWYSDRVITDEGRLQPQENLSNWTDMHQINKIAWLWQETNIYIEEFKTSVHPSRVLEIQAESIFNNTFDWKKLNYFLNLNISPQEINRLLAKPINRQNLDLKTSLSQSEISNIHQIATLSSKYYSN